MSRSLPLSMTSLVITLVASLCGCGAGEENSEVGTNNAQTTPNNAQTTPNNAQTSNNTHTSTNNAATTPSPCGRDEHVVASECVSCPAGQSNESGDDPGGADTDCDPILCAEDEYVAANTCTPCQGDTTRPAGDDASGPDTRCADVCERTLGLSCGEFDEAYIKASNTQAGDRFGQQVAIDGDTLVVGTFFEDGGSGGVNGDDTNNSADWSGAVYVFTRAGTVWSQQAYIKAAVPDADDRFGAAVAIDGDTIIIGAPGEDGSNTADETDNSVPDAGAAYVFARTGNAWTQQAYLKSPTPLEGDEFGYSVDIQGDSVVVGAPLEGPADQGAAYVFDRNGTAWTQTARLVAADAQDADTFGSTLRIAGDELAVAAPSRTRSSLTVGGVYLFARSSGSWSQTTVLEEPEPDTWLEFGRSFDFEDSTLVVASRNFSNDAVVRIFAGSGATWTEQATVDFPRHGSLLPIDLEGDRLAIGAPNNGSGEAGLSFSSTDDTVPTSGAVVLLERAGGAWSEVAILKATNPDESDVFGASVSMDADTLCIGALNEASNATGVGGDQSDNSAISAGAVYVRRIAP